MATSVIVPLNVPATRPDSDTETVRFWFVVRVPEGEIASQFVPPFCTDALAVKLVARVAVTDSVCGSGADWFSVPLKVSEVGLNENVLVPAATFSVTGTVLVVPFATSAIVPLYVPAARPDSDTEAVRFRFVVRAPEGEIESQFRPPFCTDALAVKLVALVAVTDSVCAAGADWFTVPLKVNAVGLIVNVGAVILRVTGTVSELRPELIETVPL